MLQAWVQFLRDDVAQSVNALNNRLNVVLADLRDLRTGGLSAGQVTALDEIEQEVRRAVTITGRLQGRTDAMAPEKVPEALQPLRQAATRAAHVLVVEDDPTNRSVITRLLYRLGHQVTACANGVEAMAVLELGPVDCIISDLQMPGLGGRSFYEQVEEQMPTLAARFVFVTGDYTRPASREFLERSGQPVVTKPYEVSELLGAVAAIVRRAEAV